MVRRLFVPAIVAALILGVAPSPSFGLGAREVRPRFDDHYRCMYRCDERGESWRPTWEPRPRRSDRGPWPPRPRPRPPRPAWERPGCWLFCGGGWGSGSWSGPHWWYGWWDHDRYDRYDGYDRHRDRDGSRGYDAHRHHPRGPDF
jgi:hypothetical protein